jgi:opacity protein-like surface antigen
MEVIMSKYFALSVGCLLATALVSVASAADWRQPYIYRETSGSWTNVEYNDGTCHYYYSFNSYDQNMKINRYGDCSHVTIGPDGVARPVVFMAPVAEQRVRVR